MWTLTQEQLSKTLLPIGNSPKDVVRKEAENADLITAHKKDSQGVCFLGHIDIPEFLSHYIDLEEGNVLNEAGEVIGDHKGALVYTTGQRHGFIIHTQDTNRGAFYVTDRNITDNTITVSETRKETKQSEHIFLTSVNFIGDPITVLDTFTLQTRYRQTPVACRAIAITSSELEVELLEEIEQPSIGQSCVLYSGTRCLGGGIIAECHSK